MQIDTPMLAIIVTVLLAIIALAAAWGALGQQVKRHDVELSRQHTENREDHARIFSKLEEITNYLRNGNKN